MAYLTENGGFTDREVIKALMRGGYTKAGVGVRKFIKGWDRLLIESKLNL